MKREDVKEMIDDYDFLDWQMEIINECIDKIYNDHEAHIDDLRNVIETYLEQASMYKSLYEKAVAQLKAKDKITQDIKEAYELKSIAYDLLLEAIQLKDDEIERLKEHITHLQNVYMKLDGKYLKLKTELEELKDNQ